MTTPSTSPPPFQPDLEIQDGTSAESLDPTTPEGLFAACRQRTADFLEAETETLFRSAQTDLFARAKDAPNDHVQRDCFDSLQELHRLKAVIHKAFVQGVMGNLDRLWSAEVAAEAKAGADEVDFEALSLVDTQSLEDEIAVVKVATRAGALLRQSEHALEQRLSRILPVPVTAETNPLNVRNICFTFHASIQNLGAERTSRRALFQALEVSVVARLGNLQQELNELLASHGVVPKVRYHFERGAPGPAPGEPATRAKPASPPASTPPLPEPEPAAASPVATRSEHGLPFPRAYAAAQQLLRLDRSLDPAAPLPSAATPENRPSGRILDKALSRIQASAEAADWGEKGPYAFAARVRAALARQGVQVSDQAAADVLDLVSMLLDNLISDPLVPLNTRTHIRRLGLPLGRAALLDGSFFASEAHPARQALNRLARLVDSGPPEDRDSPFSSAELAAVVDGVLAAPVPDHSVFARALDALEPLWERQRARYEAGVAALVADLERQRLLLDDRRSDDPEPSVLSAAEASHPRWQRALETVARLETGAVAILDKGPQGPKPATLIWRGPAGGALVFADALGRPAASFGRRELAMALHRGSARIDEAAHMPVVERAMFGLLEAVHGRLEDKANRDPLTGLANRARFEGALAKAMQSPSDPQQPHHVCHVQLTHLADIANRLGERAADTLLKQYGPLLERQVGDKGLVAHVGQGAMAVLLPASSRAEVLQLMERHRRSIELSRCVYRGEPLPLAVCIGVVAIAPGAADVGAVARAAREAYQAARAGSVMGLHVREDFAGTAGALDAAGGPGISALIAAGRLTLRCQRVEPVDPEAGLQTYYEVLLGVLDSAGRLTPPGELVLAAERNGQVPELDRWVVAESLRWLAANAHALGPVKGLAINLSGATLSDPLLTAFVAEQIASTGVDPAAIMFEVTESAAIEHPAVAREFIESIRHLGCRFALDDFGAGHASFSYLKLLPVDTVKIDGLFVRDIATNPADQAMVKSINEIAKLLGKRTVAEFVENEAALAHLREIGVDYAQGFGVERPRLLADLSKAAAAA